MSVVVGALAMSRPAAGIGLAGVVGAASLASGSICVCADMGGRRDPLEGSRTVRSRGASGSLHVAKP